MPQDNEPPGIPRRRNRIVGMVAAGSVLALTTAALAWTHGVKAADDTAGPEPITVTTVAVERTNLSTSRSLTGTLGYGTPRAIRGGREGVVTWLPPTGKTINRGEPLYRLDDTPVPLFIGAPPLYRTLDTTNMTGRDIAMVAKNLKALGYAIGDQPRAGHKVKQTATVTSAPDSPTTTTPAPLGNATPETTTVWTTVRKGEGVLTTALTSAIKKWQRDQGMVDDGTIEVGDLVVLPGTVRIGGVTVQAGDATDSDLMTVTQTAKAITVQATLAQADGLKAGDKVSLRMPDGTESTGEISDISTVPQIPDNGAPDTPQTVAVTVTMTDPAAADGLDGGTVEVRIEGETREAVLAVPVTALLALREGGYAIQLEDGRRIAIETGLFSGGMVEISGDSVTEGLKVVTTS